MKNNLKSKIRKVGGIARCVLCSLRFLVGCGSSGPFNMAPVSGRIAYRDGSRIVADHIKVRFVPLGVSAVGMQAPGVAAGEVNASDDSFSGLTTHKHFDGVIMGRHKVLVQAFEKGPEGIDTPIATVPAKYSNVGTTPLEVDVTRWGSSFTLLVDK